MKYTYFSQFIQRFARNTILSKVIPLIPAIIICALFTPAFCSDFTGNWSGTWSSSFPFGDSGSISANLTQTGTNLTGTLSVTDTDCGNFNNLLLTGSVSGNVASFQCAFTCFLDGSYNELRYTSGTISGNTMTGNYSVYSNGSFVDSGTFTVNRSCTYTLTTSVNPSGSGTVTKNPNKSTYCPGEQVTLTASPNSGYTFSSWSGVDSSSGTTASVTMNGNRTVTANFSQSCSCIPGYVVSSFSTSSQTTEPQGIEFINGYLYIAKGENPYYKIYKYDIQGNFIEEISTSNSCPRELTWDGSYLWHPDTCTNRILKNNLSGSTIQSFNSPYPSPCAIAWDGSYLWVSFPGQGNKIYKMDTSGNLMGVFITTPTNGYPSGLVYVNGYFWVSSYTDNKIYQIDTSGNVVSSFSAPGTQPAGLAFDGQYLWHTDSGTDRVYKIDLCMSQQGIGVIDFDGDGKTDIAIYRKSTGTWWIIPSSGGSPIGVGWGGDPSDIPVVGDWSGSGTAKIGVFRQSTGTWYLDLNGNQMWDGCGIDACIGWGGELSDIPVVGDWNGSGTAKIGVYRKSTGTWYLDLNGNRVWDGCGTDACIGWGGDPSDIPVSQ